MQTIRLVGVIRQSKYKGDQAVSEESQRQAQEGCVAVRNRALEASGKRFEIVGWAIDIGVSADKYDPWRRPQLGAWLKKPEAYDGFIAMKLDRIARNTLDFAKFMRFCDDYGKVFLCSDDPIDLTTDMGRAFAVILSVLAELELKGIKTRAKNTRKTLNEQGRWTGGPVPYGRKVVSIDGRVTLVVDPEIAAHFQRILELIFAGKARNEVAEILNNEGVPTSRTVQDRIKGREEAPRQWTGNTLDRLLRNRHLIGQREIHGMVLRDGEGKPLEYCEPLMTVTDWNRLQKKLDETSTGKSAPRKGGSLARKVGGCLDCGRNVQLGANSADPTDLARRARYRCASITARSQGRKDIEPCGNPSIMASEWDDYLEKSILDMVGALPRMEKIYAPGEDHTEELQAVDDAITSLHKEKDMGLTRSDDEYFTRLKALMDRRNKLLELPNRPAEWRYEPTGETVAEYWESMDREARNLWLQRMGVRLYYSLSGDAPRWRMVWGDLAHLPKLAQGATEEAPTP